MAHECSLARADLALDDRNVGVRSVLFLEVLLKFHLHLIQEVIEADRVRLVLIHT